MTGNYFVVRVTKENSTPIEGKDRIVKVKAGGETLVVTKDIIGQKGLLFDCETALDSDLVSQLSMFRNSDLNEDKSKKGYIEDNCRVRPIKLGSVKVSGLFIPFEALSKVKGLETISDLALGVQGNEYNGVKICKKYVPKHFKGAKSSKNNALDKTLAPYFKEHIDTDHYHKNIDRFDQGDLVYITEKLHGTSCRYGKTKVSKVNSFWKRVALLINGVPWKSTRLSWECKPVVGSRRVLKKIGDLSIVTNSFYNKDIWSEASDKFFKDKDIYDGETFYFEIVGYLDTEMKSPIMGSQDNSKLKKFMSDEEYRTFIDKYGEVTEFSYNADERNPFNIFIYRITQTLENGEVIELPYIQVIERCFKLGLSYVPLLDTLVVNDVEDLTKRVDELTESPSELFPHHVKEGVCVRLESAHTEIFKSKSFIFKVLENIIKDTETNIEEQN